MFRKVTKLLSSQDDKHSKVNVKQLEKNKQPKKKKNKNREEVEPITSPKETP